MESLLREIHQLSEILAAEADGRPVDRAEAHRLARTLGQAYPGIRRTMEQVCRRMDG
jgi:hypothetical protein